MIFIYTPFITNRIAYALQLVFENCLETPYTLQADLNAFLLHRGAKVNYSGQSIPGSLQIIPCGLLTQTGIHPQNPGTAATFAGIPTLFATPGKITSQETASSADADYNTISPLPFDLFAASFYLVTRYEEYLPDAPHDVFGRYNPEDSWAYRNNCLQRPLVDEWASQLRQLVIRIFPETHLPEPTFRFTPTYDIDQAYCYLHKGLLRNIYGAAKDLLHGRFNLLIQRWQVLCKHQPDPFDNYDWLNRQHAALLCQPVYFFLFSKRRTRLDNNLSIHNPDFQQLIRTHAQQYPIGIHPSLQAHNYHILQSETSNLATLIQQPVVRSRFHYIRFRLPVSYQALLTTGIHADYSMGYGEKNGFRAALSHPHYWYDLSQETTTTLVLHPFCFMEATAFHTRHQSAEKTAEELQHYFDILQAVNGHMNTIWHNNTLNEDNHWTGWRHLYASFLHKINPASTI